MVNADSGKGIDVTLWRRWPLLLFSPLCKSPRSILLLSLTIRSWVVVSSWGSRGLGCSLLFSFQRTMLPNVSPPVVFPLHCVTHPLHHINPCAAKNYYVHYLMCICMFSDKSYFVVICL